MPSGYQKSAKSMYTLPLALDKFDRVCYNVGVEMRKVFLPESSLPIAHKKEVYCDSMD